MRELFEDQRREAEGRLVEDQEFRPHHQRAGDRQHLLLAARQCPRPLPRPFAQDREQFQEPLALLGLLVARQALAAEIEVFLHRQFAEQLARLGAMNDPAAGDRGGAAPGERRALPADFQPP